MTEKIRQVSHELAPRGAVPRLKIHESTEEDGTLAPVWLLAEGDALVLLHQGERLVLPDGALPAVMARYGKPLAPEVRLVVVAALDLPRGGVLRHVRHLARYDVIARDYLVLDAPAGEPACALATTVSGALAHLGRASRGG